jgi:hypothetical protein
MKGLLGQGIQEDCAESGPAIANKSLDTSPRFMNLGEVSLTETFFGAVGTDYFPD